MNGPVRNTRTDKNNLLFSLHSITSFNNMSFMRLKGQRIKAKGKKTFNLLPLSFHLNKKKFRCLYRRCLPLPIPNREVKPARADGTAVKRGRVGRCQTLSPSVVQTKQ